MTSPNPIPPGGTANYSLPDFVATNGTVVNTVVARGARLPGGATSITSDPAQTACSIDVFSTITITKFCGIPPGPNNTPPAAPGTQLVSDGVRAAVRVNFSGQVCNTGPDQLTSVTIADSPAATTSPSSPFTLNPGACQPYTGNYLPAGSAIFTGDLGGIPGRYFFTDTMKVTAATAPPFAAPPAPAPNCGGALACDTRSCPICTAGACTQ